MRKLTLAARISPWAENELTCELAALRKSIDAKDLQSILARLPDVIADHLEGFRAGGTLEAELARLGVKSEGSTTLVVRITFDVSAIPVSQRTRMRTVAEFDLPLGRAPAQPDRRDHNVTIREL